MKLPEQKIAKMIGLNGCYFTCLLYIAEYFTNLDYDIINEFEYCYEQTDTSTGKKWVTENCYVNRPDLILAHYINKSVGVVKTFNLKYVPAENEVLIGCYEYNSGSHFVVLDHNLNVVFDPLGESNTVKFGKLESLRVLNYK